MTDVPDENDEPVRLTVALHPEVVDALREIAEDKGISVTEALRQSISLAYAIHGHPHRCRCSPQARKDRDELILQARRAEMLKPPSARRMGSYADAPGEGPIPG